MAVIIDSNRVTKGGCPEPTQRIIPSTVSVRKAASIVSRAVLKTAVFLKTNDNSEPKKDAAKSNVVNQKKTDSVDVMTLVKFLLSGP